LYRKVTEIDLRFDIFRFFLSFFRSVLRYWQIPWELIQRFILCQYHYSTFNCVLDHNRSVCITSSFNIYLIIICLLSCHIAYMNNFTSTCNQLVNSGTCTEGLNPANYINSLCFIPVNRKHVSYLSSITWFSFRFSLRQHAIVFSSWLSSSNNVPYFLQIIQHAFVLIQLLLRQIFQELLV
jgi:hypothetical protein